MSLSVSLADRLVIQDTGWAMPIVNMFDIDGDETDIPEDACSIVAGPTQDDQWMMIRLSGSEHDMKSKLAN